MDLLQANEQLVLSALRIRAIADAALAELESLRRISEQDTLTGVANRRFLMRALEQSIVIAQREAWRCAVMFVDIDDFKQINDSLGHVAGDEVLIQVAACMQSAVRVGDLVSRHGGEEFIVLLPHIDDTDEASAVAERIHAAMAAQGQRSRTTVQVSVSIGIAIFPDAAHSAMALIDHADTAMYQSKHNGPGGSVVYVKQPPELESGPIRRSSRQRASGDLQRRLSTLCDTNQELLLSALAAQEHEADAQAAQERQSRFLAIVAHELRNPLTPILTAASLLDRVQTDESLLKRMQLVIEQQVMYMVRLIDDLLDRSRASAGKFRLQLQLLDFRDVVQGAVQTCTSAIDLRGQTLIVELPAELVQVSGDRGRLLQVCTNLLDNASKYTPDQGEIRLRLVASVDHLVLSVCDNGIGIAAADMPHIFDLFAQDPRAVRYHAGGLGIGLAVVRELVDAHGGSLQVSSKGRDLGSEFLLTLPLATAPTAPQAVQWDEA